MKRALLFDTETSGLEEPEIIEAAWLDLGAPPELEVLGSFVERYRPSKPIELNALAVHHILDEELVDCPPSDAFRLPEDTAYITGHQIDFDWKAAGSPPCLRIDTMAMVWKLWPELGKLTQTAALYALSADRRQAKAALQGAHSALADVTNCLVVLHAICDKLGVTSWEKLWEFSEEARVPDVMPFGKHRGTAMADVPRDYKDWLLRQEIDPYLRKALLR